MDRVRTVYRHSATRYFIVGMAAFWSDYAVLLLLYNVLHVPLVVSTALGFITGLLVSFITNRYWVFRGVHRKRLLRQSVEYVLLVILNFFFTVWSVAFLAEHGIKPSIGKLGIMGLIMCWNYVLFRWVIFTQRSEM